MAEFSRNFQEMRNPCGMIDKFLLTIGFEDECESLTLLGVEPQTLLDLGLVVVDESGDVVFGQEEVEVTGLREEPRAAATSGNSHNPCSSPTSRMVDNCLMHVRLKLVRRFNFCARNCGGIQCGLIDSS